jgi:hypothetical protein
MSGRRFNFFWTCKRDRREIAALALGRLGSCGRGVRPAMAKRVRSFETDELGPAKSDSKPKPEFELAGVTLTRH